MDKKQLQQPEMGFSVPPNTPATPGRQLEGSSDPAPQAPVALTPTPPPSPPSPAKPLSFVQRVGALPLVACTALAYKSARAEGGYLSLGILCSEIAVGLATLPVRAVAAPLAMLCPLPVRIGDRLLCLWLDCVEAMVPCIKGPPRKMCRPVRICYRMSRNKIRAIPGLVWMSTNDLLSTSCGELLMSSSERVMLSVDGYIDLVIPSPDSSDGEDANCFLVLLARLAHMPTATARYVHTVLRGLLDHVARRAQEAKEAAELAEAEEMARLKCTRRSGKKLF